MEEKKSKPQVPQGEGQQKKLSYDELNETCMQLYQQNQTLMRQLAQANYTNMFKRLDYLFMVVENMEVFDDEFINSCVDEIKEALTPAEKEEQSIN